MARGGYVYVVVDGEVPLTAFTVRYELGQWYRREAHQHPGATYCRVKDGGYPTPPVWIDPILVAGY
jgi:hypothetical protein